MRRRLGIPDSDSSEEETSSSSDDEVACDGSGDESEVPQVCAVATLDERER